MAEIVLTKAQGGVVRAKVGDVLMVRLPENPTTGYRWQVDEASGLTHAGDDFSLDSAALGAGGERVLRFLVTTPGTMHLRLLLKRAWEVGGAPQDQFSVTVTSS